MRDLDTRRFYMFYEAFDAQGRRSIGLAVSEDGSTSWQRHPEPVLTGSGERGAWDSHEVGAPYAVSMAAGKWRLYYCGKGEGGTVWQGVGAALSDEQAEVLAAPTAFRRRVGT